MLLSSRDYRNQQGQVGRRRPATLYANAGDLFSAGFEALRLTGSTGRVDSLRIASREIYDWYEGRTGQSASTRAQELALELSAASNLGRDGKPMAFVPRTQVAEDDPRVARRLLEEYLEQNPDAAESAPAFPEDRAPELAAEAEREFEELNSRASTWGATAGFAGQFAAGMVAPESLATLFIGGGPVGAVGLRAVGRVAGREAVIGAGSEAAIQPFVQAWREEAGLDSGFWNALYDVALVGGASATLGGLVRGIVEVRTAIRAGKDTPASAAYRLYRELSPQARAQMDGAWNDANAVAAVVTQQFENNPRFVAGLTSGERTAIERIIQDRKALVALGAETPAEAQATRAAVNATTETVETGLPARERPNPPAATPRAEPAIVIRDDGVTATTEAELDLPEGTLPVGLLDDEDLRKAVEDALARAADEAPPPRAEPEPPATPQLPPDLRGGKPRFGYQDRNFELEFESDVDRALYVVAGTRKSRADERYREFLRAQGLSDAAIDREAANVRARVKNAAGRALEQDGDVLAVPAIPRLPDAPPRAEAQDVSGVADRSAEPSGPMAREAAQAESEVAATASKTDEALATEAEGSLERRTAGDDFAPDAKEALDDAKQAADAADATVRCRNGG